MFKEFKEKQHFGALLLSHPKICDHKNALSSFLSLQIEMSEELSSSDFGTVTHFKCLSDKIYHKGEDQVASGVKRVKTRTIDGKVHYVYNCYMISFADKVLNQSYYLIATPFRKMLKDKIDSKLSHLKSEKASFLYIDIPALIGKLKNSEENSQLFITRINLQSVSSTGIKSIALYGDDVVLSPQFVDYSQSTRPSSLRIVYKDEDPEPFSLNTDRFGNWSFYLRNQMQLNHFYYIFSYLQDNNILRKTYNDPRDRRSAIDERLEMD